jgi:Mg-chelatase subunit ChlD
MLRRSKKMGKLTASGDHAVLGISPTKRRNEAISRLETVVFGGEHDIVDRLEERLHGKAKVITV